MPKLCLEARISLGSCCRSTVRHAGVQGESLTIAAFEWATKRPWLPIPAPGLKTEPDKPLAK